MPHRKHHKQHRKPTPAESYLCLILVGVLIFLSTALGAPIQFGIVLATAAAFLMSMRRRLSAIASASSAVPCSSCG